MIFLFSYFFLCLSSQGIIALEQVPEASSSPTFSFSTNSPIYVVGDVHGAYSTILDSLKTLKLVNQENQWTGGTNHFVSLGDLMDRGPSSRQVMDLFMELQIQAEKAGGKFHVVLGNHEIMNLTGDLRYLSEKEIAEFADDETQEQRTQAYDNHLKWSQLDDSPEALAKFDKLFPTGFFARRKAFSLSGKYGQWLTGLPFVIRINEHIFTHGGLSKQAENYSLEEFNLELKLTLNEYLISWESFIAQQSLSPAVPFASRIQIIDALKKSDLKKKFLKSGQHFLFSNESPTWFRGNAVCHPFFEEDNLKQRLNGWQADHLWVGHTTSQTRSPLHRLNNSLTIMDTGMLNSHYKGQPWVAKIRKEEKPVYIHGLTAEIGQSTQSVNREWSNPYNMTDNQVESFLLTADITVTGSTKEGKTKPYKVELTKSGKKIKGIFKYKDTDPKNEKGNWSKSDSFADRYQYEMAAYKLDRLLGIGLVPVTVERKVNGKSGVIQLWIDGLISELQMKANKIPFEGDCGKKDQNNLINTFDYLISNRDRNQSNVLYSQEDLQIWFIDHSRGFGTIRKRPKMLRKTKIILSERFREALKKLTFENLQILKPWLHTRQITAMIKRRDKLLRGRF